MNITTCTRRLQFCMGHRVYGHEGKCRNLHGHNYVALFEAQGPELDSLARVIDFGVLKERIGDWIDRNWDHCMVLWKDDPQCESWNTEEQGPLFKLPDNPTAESLAGYLVSVVCPQALADTGVEVVTVTLWETENCCATVKK